LLFLTLNHLLVLLAYLIHSTLPCFCFALGFVSVYFDTAFISHRFGLQKRESFQASSLSLLVVLLSLALSVFSMISRGWAVVSPSCHLPPGKRLEPYFKAHRTFDKNNDLSIVHFPKGSWYYAATVLSTFGNLGGW
jgi:hypothetical protein